MTIDAAANNVIANKEKYQTSVIVISRGRRLSGKNPIKLSTFPGPMVTPSVRVQWIRSTNKFRFNIPKATAVHQVMKRQRRETGRFPSGKSSITSIMEKYRMTFAISVIITSTTNGPEGIPENG